MDSLFNTITVSCVGSGFELQTLLCSPILWYLDCHGDTDVRGRQWGGLDAWKPNKKRAGRCALTNGGKFADSFERVNIFEWCRNSVALLEESQQELKASGVRLHQSLAVVYHLCHLSPTNCRFVYLADEILLWNCSEDWVRGKTCS